MNSDYNFVPDGKSCVPSGPEVIPEGECLNAGDTFHGSSGYRKIPGNTCIDSKGIHKDKPKQKSCKEGLANPGMISHSSFTFPSLVRDHAYFEGSSAVIAYTSDQAVWQSDNDGLSWKKVSGEGEKILTMTMHQYQRDRAYLITGTRKVSYTTNKGARWESFAAPEDPNGFGISILDFHPTKADWLIWTGQADCKDTLSQKCRAVAYYTKDHGRNWARIDSYVKTCAWGRDKSLKIDDKVILCESYQRKEGNQLAFGPGNPLQLIWGGNFYKSKKILFDSVVGWATFEEYMVAAEVSLVDV
jgi:hypothetical protein